MRWFPVKAALTAALIAAGLSFSAGGAFAFPPFWGGVGPYWGYRWHPYDPYWGWPHAYWSAPHYYVYNYGYTYKPPGRLDTVLGELHSDAAQIRSDRAIGVLAGSSAGALISEDAAIRAEAEHSTDANGDIPFGEYMRLQGEVDGLARNIAAQARVPARAG